MSIRVLIADHQEVMRAGLKSFLAGTSTEVVAEANTPKELMKLLKQQEPNVVILDVRFAGEDGFDVLSAIKQKFKDVPVLMWSTSDNPTYIALAIALGASGYLPRSIERAEMLATIRKVASGKAAWTDEQLSTYQGVPELPPSVTVHLTRREREVLRQLAFGLGNKQIGLALGISYETVKEHIQHILRKLNYTDRVQAAVWALRHDLA